MPLGHGPRRDFRSNRAESRRHVSLGLRHEWNARCGQPDIGDYNAFVQAQAGLNPSLTGTDEGVSWRAIASTWEADARANALITAHVYLLDGTTKIADGYADMWDGDLDNRLNKTQYGHYYEAHVWTGSTPYGTRSGIDPLGSSPDSMYGISLTSSVYWIRYARADYADHKSLYALSEELTVPTPEPEPAVPEPASVVVWLCLASVLGVGMHLRRRIGRRV